MTIRFRSAMHPAELPIAVINAALPAGTRLLGCWVQRAGDGTWEARPVRVSIQYGWQGAALAEYGEGGSVAEAAEELIARLRDRHSQQAVAARRTG